MKRYQDFINDKVAAAPMTGFKIDRSEVNAMLKPHQIDCVCWSILGGCRGIFILFGLGKTFIQLEIMRIIKKFRGGKVLIVCPLGIRQEFTEAGKRLGITTEYITSDAAADASTADVLLTNYERIREGQVTPAIFTAISLDEGDVLRSAGSKPHHEFIRSCQTVPFKFVATATPSPNDYIELIFYACFLGVMDKNQAKTRFFKRDSTKADNLTIHPHKVDEFWDWCRSWGIFLQYPSDLGYSDDGYVLPPLNVQWDCIGVDHSSAGFDRDGQGKLFRDAALGLGDAAREKHLTLKSRIEKMKSIVAEYPEQNVILWHDLEEERRAIKKAIPKCKEIYGSLDLDTREKLTLDFANGKFQYLATKPCISGAGCNFQRHCSTAIFTGVGFKFRDVIQAIHRIFRYMQTKEVNIRFIYAESESEIVARFKEKWRQHDKMMATMRDLIKKYGLSNIDEIRGGRQMKIERREAKGEFYTAVNNDCVIEVAAMPENSVGLIHTSIPFSIQYEYSNSYFDFGHNDDNAEFFRQMDFLIPELLRVLEPGRVCAVHVKDRIIPGNFSGLGMASLYPFSDETRAAFEKHGFIFFGRITVVTDVVRENNQTYRLTYGECRKDGTKMGVGVPEYVLLFRKRPSNNQKSYADDPVVKAKEDYSLARWQLDAHGFWRSNGNRFLTDAEMEGLTASELQEYFKRYSINTLYDYKEHVAIGEDLAAKDRLAKTFFSIPPESLHPNVWTDIVRIKTLNTTQSQRRQQQHVCPLQFDIVERIINRYTNAGDLVLDPFGGIMTVPFMAVKMGRRGYGVELSSDYWSDGVKYCAAAEAERNVPTLFDMTSF